MSSGSALVLLAHPRVGSFNHAIADRVVGELSLKGIDVRFHDLYAEGFDPLLRADEAYTSGREALEVLHASDDPLVIQHRRELGEASAVVAIHPNWWGKPPAMMAGWLDRVLIPGVAYRLSDGGGAPTSLLTIQELLVVNTSDTTAERETALFGDPLDAIWRRCLPPYLGEPIVDRLVLRVVADAGPAQRSQWLEEVAARSAALANRLHPGEVAGEVDRP